jgi:class 3 adenylate cyclase
MNGQPALATVLVTDLVSSTSFLQEIGDERGQRVFRAHQKMLQDLTSSNGGIHIKWMGDGLLAVFHSAADAVRCAIRLQQAAQRPISGHRLEIRVGLHCGEVTQRGEDYFGETVELADTICNSGEGGQILCSSFITDLLYGRQAFSFLACSTISARDGEDVTVCEVQYEADRPGVLLDRPPFTGREHELETLEQALRKTAAGSGSLVLLAGEPGIGKSRLTQELMEIARDEGTTVMSGQCYEGDWTPPYGPFAEAIEGYAAQTDGEQLQHDLGPGAAAIARIAPAVRDKVPETGEPARLRPEEERVRLFDAVAQFLKARSSDSTTLLVLASRCCAIWLGW